MREDVSGDAIAIKFLTVNQIATLLQRSLRTLETWRRNGNGPPFIRIGRRVLYRCSDIEAWLAENRYRSRAHELQANSSLPTARNNPAGGCTR
jgi:excisionase family DNA binding protein